MNDVQLYYEEIETPVGLLLLISTGEKVVRIDYGPFKKIEPNIQKWAYRYFRNVSFQKNGECLRNAKEELLNYFNGNQQTFHFPIEFYGTSFQQEVWYALCHEIPFGLTKTYKDIAMLIGKPKAARAVGGAVNKNPLSIVVPCHRVIGVNGSLTGYNGGLDKKEFLLRHEGYLLNV